MADSTSFSKRQRVIYDNEIKDDDIDMNAPISTIGRTTHSNSKVSKKKEKVSVVLTQETNKTPSFANKALKSVVLYTSKKKSPLPDVDNSNNNNTDADRVLSDEKDDFKSGKNQVLIIVDLCPSMVFQAEITYKRVHRRIWATN